MFEPFRHRVISVSPPASHARAIRACVGMGGIPPSRKRGNSVFCPQDRTTAQENAQSGFDAVEHLTTQIQAGGLVLHLCQADSVWFAQDFSC